ncbi:MAG: glycerate kinase [Muribaculaceae bacterium]|nr:glycerate kinase [Muribaculaceae bacterium]
MIVLAPDKFKGTLSASEVADAMARGLRRAGVRDDVRGVRMADGGEGMAYALGAVAVSDIKGAYILPDGRGLLMSAEICGASLRDVKPELRSTRRLGEAVRLLSTRVPEVLIGVGGTLTADGGAGYLQGLGYEFFDESGCVIFEDLSPEVLVRRGLSRVSIPAERLPKVMGLCDVACPIFAPESELSALSFIRQKGFDTPELAEIAECALSLINNVLLSNTEAYGGAGGGLGYAIGVLPGAICRSGAEYVIEANAAVLGAARLIVTGEGSIDAQTRGGKCVDALQRFARERHIPVLAVGGRVNPSMVGPMVIGCRAWDSSMPDSHTAAMEVENSVADWAMNYFAE